MNSSDSVADTAASGRATKDGLDTFFGITENNSTIRTEIMAGLATFLAGSYIIVVNPAVLSDAGFIINNPATLIGMAGLGLTSVFVSRNLPAALVKKVERERYDEAIPAFLAVILMPLTYSITMRMGYGFLSFVAIQALTGRLRDVEPALLIVAALCVVMLTTV